MKYRYFVILFILFFCVAFVIKTFMPSRSNKPAAQPLSPSFNSQLASFLASTNEYESETIWNNLKLTLDRNSPKEMRQWLDLQKIILMSHTNNYYSNDSLRSGAIQQFRVFSDYAEPYRSWLFECKTNGLFSEPFIIANLDLILEKMKDKKQ